MLEIDKKEWIINAHLAISEELLHCLNNYNQGSWSENYITTRMLMAITNMGNDIKWTSMSQRIRWDSFKLKGKRETELGDIAFFMKVMLTSEVYLEGVAFYEAKKQYYDEKWETEGFKSIKLNQLTRIQKFTSASNVLLYDVDIKSGKAHVSSLPTLFVEKLLKEAPAAVPYRALNKYGNAWVNLLAENLSGFGLDYSPDAVNKMRELVNTPSQPLLIINASVNMMGAFEPVLDNSFIPTDRYENLITTPPTPSTPLKKRKCID